MQLDVFVTFLDIIGYSSIGYRRRCSISQQSIVVEIKQVVLRLVRLSGEVVHIAIPHGVVPVVLDFQNGAQVYFRQRDIFLVLVVFHLQVQIDLIYAWESIAVVLLHRFYFLKGNPCFFICHFFSDFLQSYLNWFFFLNCAIFDVVVLLYVGVEPIFDFVLGSAGEIFADLGPFPSNLGVEFYYFSILFISPIFLLYFWIKFVDESLSNLLPCFAPQHLAQQFPVFSYFFHQSPDCFIFFR